VLRIQLLCPLGSYAVCKEFKEQVWRELYPFAYASETPFEIEILSVPLTREEMGSNFEILVLSQSSEHRNVVEELNLFAENLGYVGVEANAL